MSSHDEVFGEGGSDPGLLEAAIQRRKFLQYGLGATAAAVGGSVLTQGVVGGIARAAAAGTPTTLNVATSLGATNLDPNSLDGLSCSQIWSMCYDTFFNTGYPAGLTAAEAYLKHYDPEPLLATSHVLSGGGKVWTFNLARRPPARRGIRSPPPTSSGVPSGTWRCSSTEASSSTGSGSPARRSSPRLAITPSR